MSIKTKISLGVVFLFAMLLTLTILGVYNLHIITNDMKGVLTDNFESIDYSKNMLQSLEGLRILNGELQIEEVEKNFQPVTLNTQLSIFEKNLAAQENNITEIGEKELTDSVRSNFEELKKTLYKKKISEIPAKIYKLNSFIYKISDVNSKAITKKNIDAENKAKKGIFLVSIVATFCLLTSFTLVINFPAFIADPIKELTAGIKEIANRNYDQRLHFKSNDEFGEVSKAFNAMASRLFEYQNTTLARIFLEKSRFEIIIDKIKYPVLGVDGNNKIFFVNQNAALVFGLQKQDLIDKSATEIALRNDLMRTILAENYKDQQINIFFENKECHFRIQIIKIEIEDNFVGKAYLLMVN